MIFPWSLLGLSWNLFLSWLIHDPRSTSLKDFSLRQTCGRFQRRVQSHLAQFLPDLELGPKIGHRWDCRLKYKIPSQNQLSDQQWELFSISIPPAVFGIYLYWKVLFYLKFICSWAAPFLFAKSRSSRKGPVYTKYSCCTGRPCFIELCLLNFADTAFFFF